MKQESVSDGLLQPTYDRGAVPSGGDSLHDSDMTCPGAPAPLYDPESADERDCTRVLPPLVATACRDFVRELCCATAMQMSSPLTLPEEDRIRDLPLPR